MVQIRIPFAYIATTATSGPYAKWKNIKLKQSDKWKVGFVEIKGHSYGDLLKPTQEHTVGMFIDVYDACLKINNKTYFKQNTYFEATLVLDVINDSVKVDDFIEYLNESFYDH